MPVAQLVKLLTQDERVEQNIRDTQSALGLMKKRIAESLVQHSLAETGEKPLTEEADLLMKEERAYERLLQALRDMKGEIAKQIRPLEEEIVQANIEHVKELMAGEQKRLAECLEELDRKLLSCRLQMEEYECAVSHLRTLNGRLSRLGAEPLPISDSIVTNDLGSILKEKIDRLRSQGRF